MLQYIRSWLAFMAKMLKRPLVAIALRHPYLQEAISRSRGRDGRNFHCSVALQRCPHRNVDCANVCNTAQEVKIIGGTEGHPWVAFPFSRHTAHEIDV